MPQDANCSKCLHGITYFGGAWYHFVDAEKIEKKCHCGCETPVPLGQG